MTDKLDDTDIMDRARALLELERIEKKDGDRLAWMGLKFLAMPPDHTGTAPPSRDGAIWKAASIILTHHGDQALTAYRRYLRAFADGEHAAGQLPGLGRPPVKLDAYLYRYEGGGRLLEMKPTEPETEIVMDPNKIRHLAETARGIAIFQKPDAEGWPDGVLPHDERERLVKAADAVLDDLGVTNRKPAPAPGSGSS